MWIQNLREVCEKSFDTRETGQLEVESLRGEWHKAFSEKEVDEALLDGLERRAILLLGCLLYTSPSPRDMRRSRMPSSA